METIHHRDGPLERHPYAGILPFEPPCTPSKPRKRKITDRDQPHGIKLSYYLGVELEIIAQQQKLTLRQVRYALAQPATHKKKSGRPRKLP
jgi:hypothetical protein